MHKSLLNPYIIAYFSNLRLTCKRKFWYNTSFTKKCMLIAKIVSGGQTGVDRGALAAYPPLAGVRDP